MITAGVSLEGHLGEIITLGAELAPSIGLSLTKRRNWILPKNMSLVMRKLAFCICENKDEDQLHGQHLCFRCIVQSLYFLNTKFQATSHLVWLYSLVCVGPGPKPRRPVFSQRGSYIKVSLVNCGLPTASGTGTLACNINDALKTAKCHLYLRQDFQM